MKAKAFVLLPLLGILGTVLMSAVASAQVDVSAYPFAALEADWEHNDTWLEFQKVNSGGAFDIPPVVNVGGGNPGNGLDFIYEDGVREGGRRVQGWGADWGRGRDQE